MSKYDYDDDLVVPERPQYIAGDNPPSTKAAMERAEKENLKVVYPSQNELQIDIDSEAQFAKFTEQLGILSKWLGVKTMVVAPSKSGAEGRLHVTIESKRRFSVPERICLQALLASDLKREALGFLMMKNGEPRPTLFLEKK